MCICGVRLLLACNYYVYDDWGVRIITMMAEVRSVYRIRFRTSRIIPCAGGKSEKLDVSRAVV